VGFGGDLNLIQNQDVLCYNLTLQRQFSSRPGIAVAVSSFQATQSPDLYFSIKPVKDDLSGVVPFIIRTQWKYTQWSSMTVRIFIENRQDIEAGYYQLDSGALASCDASKNVNIQVPLHSQWQGFNANLQSVVFLHGFEISTQSFTRSPF